MPFGIHKHSNRSRQALNDQAVQGPAPSSGDSSASALFTAPSASTSASTSGSGEHQQYQNHPQAQEQSQQPTIAFPQPQTQPQSHPLPHAETQPYPESHSPAHAPESEQRAYQNTADVPARSQSTRFPSAYQAQQPQQVSHPQLGGSVNNSSDSLDSRKVQQQQQLQQARPHPAPAPAPIPEQKKSKSIFDRMRSNRLSQSDPKALSQGQYNNTTGLARRLSKRQENPPPIRTVRSSLDQQRVDWQPAAQDSRSHLPSPQEGNEDDSGLDPYLIRGRDQESPHDQSSQDQGQQPTIRPVQNDSDLAPLNPNDDGRHYQPQQQQHSLPQAYHYRSDSNSQVPYDVHNQGHYPPQQLNHQPGLIIHDPYRQQHNPETVSQLSHDSPIEQREEQRPISVQSNGQSPTSYQRPQFPDRTTSIQGPRPLSQVVTAMAPPTGASQQNRRSADPKQTLQGAQAQGQPEPQQGPPPNYSRGQSYTGNQPPTPGLSPMPSSVSTQGSAYRGGPPQRADQYGPQAAGEQGRSTPPPQPAGQDVAEAYKELRKLQKYSRLAGH